MKMSEILAQTTPKPAILLAGNGTETLGRIKANAGLDSYDIQAMDDGAAALLMLPRVKPSLIVLDVGLQNIRWMNFYELVRNEPSLTRTPILILTDTVDEVSSLCDFGLGNTDFMLKPVAPPELTLRARRLLYNRQTADVDPKILDYEDMQLDISRHKVSVQGNPIYLTATQFKLLATLAQRQGRVQTREQLLQDVCHYNSSFLHTRAIDTHMRRLRVKLGPAQWHLESVRGVGYQFREKPQGRQCVPKSAARRSKTHINASPRFKVLSAALS
jgi:two-component system phosphate regulon response regulator PhoB